MISKEEFIEIINRLKEVSDFVDEVNDKAKNLKIVAINDFFNAMSLTISHEDIVVKLLEKIFKDSITLSWWIYDLDFGRLYTERCFTEEDGTPIDVSTAEKLYDYLISEIGE